MFKSKAKSVMVIAGEASGDLHGAMLVKALQPEARQMVVFGIGGQAMKAAGVRIVIDAASVSVVGITEVVSRMAALRRAVAAAKQMLRKLSPDLLVLIDFPDFNLHVAATPRHLVFPCCTTSAPSSGPGVPGGSKKSGAWWITWR